MCSDLYWSQWCTNLISTASKQLMGTTETPSCPTHSYGDSPTVVTNASTMTTIAADNNGAQSSRTSCDTERQDGVSLGLAIGLLFVGMAIGVIVTCLLYVCVPTLNSHGDTTKHECFRVDNEVFSYSTRCMAPQLLVSLCGLRLQDLCAVKTTTESAGVEQTSDRYNVNDKDKIIIDENIYTRISVSNEKATFSTPSIVPRDESNLHEMQTSRDGTKNFVHVGAAVGLLCVGLAVGAIVTCLLCTCVPILHRKATLVLMRNGASRLDAKQHEHTILQPQVRRTALARTNSSSDSHIYNIIQHDIPLAGHGPIEMGLANSENPAQSFQAVQAISSPVYTVVAENIIKSSSSSTDQTYQSLNERNLDTNAYNYGPLELSGNNTQNETRADIDISENSADQNYFILKSGSATASDMEYGEQEVDENSAHAYFVLEKKFGTSVGSTNPLDVSQPEPTHDYFVLESKI